MKKVLALVLAVVLAFGMATVAFAAPAPQEADFSALSGGYYTKDFKTGKILDSGAATALGTVEPGTTMYFPVTDLESPAAAIEKLSAVSNFRLGYSIDDGKNMIKSVKLVAEKSQSTNKKAVYVAVTTNDNFIMESQDVAMTITASAKSGAFLNTKAAAGENASQDYTLAFTAAYATDSASNGYKTLDKATILSFDEDADDVVLCFDKDVEVAGNFKGQKDVFLRMGTMDDKVTDKYPDATIRYFDGNKDTFKREVTVTIPYESADADKAPYIYENVNGKLTAVKDAKYTDGAFVFKTKTLGNYVISDVALKDVVEDEKTEGEGTTGTETNPETGANDFVGLAVALAVVSVAGIAVAKK